MPWNGRIPHLKDLGQKEMTARPPSNQAPSLLKGSRPKPRFEPGTLVERSGIYEAFHASHRVTHQVTLLEGQTFPPCARCKDKVRFELVRAQRRLTPQNSPVVHVVGVFTPEAA